MSEEELLTFFKALADANRLRMVGLLAREPASVEALAAALGLRASTVSHHLAKLGEAGLVSATTDGHYHLYRLDTDALQAMARRIGSPEPLVPVGASAADAWEQKVLDTFTGPDGRFRQLPMQRKKLQVLLRHVLKDFEPGRTWCEREVNAILKRHADDTATLRRGLIDYQLMAREPDGSRWWVVEA